jgi:hypothetical protein
VIRPAPYSRNRSQQGGVGREQPADGVGDDRKTENDEGDAMTVGMPKPIQITSIGAIAMIGTVWNSTAYGYRARCTQREDDSTIAKRDPDDRAHDEPRDRRDRGLARRAPEIGLLRERAADGGGCRDDRIPVVGASNPQSTPPRTAARAAGGTFVRNTLPFATATSRPLPALESFEQDAHLARELRIGAQRWHALGGEIER